MWMQENKRSSSSIFLSSLLLLSLAGCDGGAQQTGSSKQPASNDATNDGTGVGTGVGNDVNNGDTNNGGGSASGSLASFCSKAAETNAIKNKLGNMFQKLCSGGNATSLMSNDLVSSAYSGGGNPNVKKIEQTANNTGDKTTTMTIGVGIKLPIDIKTHFDKVGPKGGDVAAQEKIATAQGAKGTVKILQTYKNDGQYHVRGWKVNAHNEKSVLVTKIITDTTGRTDQYELESGSAYLYTQYLLEKGQGIAKFDMVTAGVKIGNDSYLLTVAQVVANNMGIPAVAEQQILDTAKGLVKAMYTAAQEAK